MQTRNKTFESQTGAGRRGGKCIEDLEIEPGPVEVVARMRVYAGHCRDLTCSLARLSEAFVKAGCKYLIDTERILSETDLKRQLHLHVSHLQKLDQRLRTFLKLFLQDGIGTLIRGGDRRFRETVSIVQVHITDKQ